jgi:uncharacterized RDD family membrane protein YckC
MSAARPYLASVQQRLVAFALDSSILLLATLITFGVIDALGQSPMLIVWIFPILYLAYHTAVLTNHDIAFGRVVASISVVSNRGDAPTLRQALVRGVSRTTLVALGIAGALGSREPWVIFVPSGVEVALMMVSPWRQSIADLVAGTLVVRTPQIQPHRAPAAPMYSATDSEFGLPPKWRG